MSPIFEQDGKWWFRVFDTLFGPYTDADEAMEALTYLFAGGGTPGCPSCEGD